jgi:predicted patatin/cPLA2 family phospholipase
MTLKEKTNQRLIRKIRSSSSIPVVADGTAIKETYSDSIMDAIIIQNGLLAELLI